MTANQQLIDRCIQQCETVVRIANQCADACLTGGQADTMARCIHLCLDCSSLASACTALLARNSQFAGAVCGVLATLCDACDAECEQHQGELMAECAKACRSCAATCRQMAA